MTVSDLGPGPSFFDLGAESRANDNYRAVAWSGQYLQVTLMSIPPGESIGLEAHPETDQFVRLDGGRGHLVMGPAKDDLPIHQDVHDGWAVMVPAGTWHDVVNTGDEPLKLFTVYAPVHHASGIVQPTPDDALRDEQSGADAPPPWSSQPGTGAHDEHSG